MLHSRTLDSQNIELALYVPSFEKICCEWINMNVYHKKKQYLYAWGLSTYLFLPTHPPLWIWKGTRYVPFHIQVMYVKITNYFPSPTHIQIWKDTSYVLFYIQVIYMKITTYLPSLTQLFGYQKPQLINHFMFKLYM
jgi:hypothetical protein